MDFYRCKYCGSVFPGQHRCGGVATDPMLGGAVLTALQRNEMIQRDRDADPGYEQRRESDWRTQLVMNIPVGSPYKECAGTETAHHDESGVDNGQG